MPPSNAVQTLLSPAELSYIHSSLAQDPPIRLDSRSVQQFRPLVAECDILPTTNGSARVCFSDGTEAIVGVKAEVEKSKRVAVSGGRNGADNDEQMNDDDADAGDGLRSSKASNRGHSNWLEISVEIPGFRDDDNMPVFLGSMLSEALIASKSLLDKLYLNDNWHWKLYIDILLLSPPLSYPLPLLSLTTHLALLNTRLPRRVSEPADDPLFDDDWAAAVPLYPATGALSQELPPVTLLVMIVGNNALFDPSREELAVAEAVLAISIAQTTSADRKAPSRKVLAVRVIDPPSRLTPLGVPNSSNPATGDVASNVSKPKQPSLSADEGGSVWSPPKGGLKRGLISRIIESIIADGGACDEVLAGLACVET